MIRSAEELRGRRVLVVGLGDSGMSAVETLRDLGAEIVVSENRDAGDVADLASQAEALGARVLTGGHRPEHLEGVHLTVLSPGVPEHTPIVGWAQEHSDVWSELELGARVATVPYLAITGTNGKTTTTEMIAGCLRESGRSAVACGNVGHPFSRAAREAHSVLVVEASSFQLRFSDAFHPVVSVLLNLAPDHLDWHGSFDAYADAKARIYRRQQTPDVHIGNREDPEAAALSKGAPCRVAWFTTAEPGDGEVGFVDDRLVAQIEGRLELGKVAGAPALRANSAAAAAASIAFGADPASVARGLGSFVQGPHRGGVVAEAGGVRFVDDSKATNPHATLASVRANAPAVLIAGGRGKGLDLSPLAAVISSLRGVVAMGEAAEEVTRIFSGSVPVRTASSVEEAAAIAFEMAGPGIAVLLAPACASQDMFRDYRERGERFSVAARRLADEHGREDG